MSVVKPLTTIEFLLTSPHHMRPFAADARYLPDGRPKPILVFVHGFKGFKDWGHFNVLAEYMARRGFVFVKLDLSHNGVVPGGSGDLEDLEAFGRNNFSIELDDLGVLLDHLYNPQKNSSLATEMDPTRLFLVGHSRGGGLALLKAAEDARVRAVATWAAINDIDQRWPDEFMRQWKETGVQYVDNSRTGQRLPMYYQLVEDYLANQPRLDIPGNVREKLPQPLLIVHGDEDETVPVQAAYALKSWKPDAELIILPGAMHMFGGAHPWQENKLPAEAKAIADHTIAFFQKI